MTSLGRSRVVAYMRWTGHLTRAEIATKTVIGWRPHWSAQYEQADHHADAYVEHHMEWHSARRSLAGDLARWGSTSTLTIMRTPM
jgi:hypothetical protein